ncbi:MAG TPA: Uma2 family endonuclease [Isosphaeraceae bacterium]|jgi:Uma2 family endonuclease|nr:Uma2 family endonuclease [Isosphaeraceae bacterium]
MATHEPPLTTRLVLGPDDAGRPVSADEYATADYREPWKYERADGRLRVMAPDGYDHQITAEPWRNELSLYKSKHPERVQHVFPNAWVRVDDDSDLIGDIGVYLVSDEVATNPPDRSPELMFEILSPGRASNDRDYVRKRDDYFRAGIREYVIIDRFTRTVTVFSQGAAGYDERKLSINDVYTSALLPGLSIPLAGVMGSQES